MKSAGLPCRVRERAKQRERERRRGPVIPCNLSVCEKCICLRAAAVQSSGGNCSPAPVLVLCKLVFPHVLFSGGVFFTDTGMVKAGLRLCVNVTTCQCDIKNTDVLVYTLDVSVYLVCMSAGDISRYVSLSLTENTMVSLGGTTCLTLLV